MNDIKQWFAVYTRSKCEKKVTQYLTKEKIENYCPLNKVVRQWSDRKKVILEPLFTSYVFVRITQKDHTRVKRISGIVNMVYWLGKPAIIRDQEIDMIKIFLHEYTNVNVIKSSLRVDDNIKVLSGPLVEQQGTVVLVKGKTVKVELPSLRYIMSAELEISNVEVIQKARKSETINKLLKTFQ